MDQLISIIIPTYNRAFCLGETLDSILEQSYKNWECIIIDDESNDHTSELVGSYVSKDDRIIYFKRPLDRQKGANSCRNYGFEICNGGYVIFFDSDDLMTPHYLAMQMKSMLEKSAAFSISEVLYFNTEKTNLDTSWNGKIKSNKPYEAYIKGEISWLTSSIMWSKQFLLSLDYLFDEELRASQEWELIVRILRQNPKFTLVEKPMVYMRRHENNITYGLPPFFRLWHYYLARLKIYQNNSLNEKRKVESFLRIYLIDGFKNFSRNNQRYAMEAFKRFILKEKTIRPVDKLMAFMSIWSFKLFGKGEFLLKKLNS